MYQAGRRLVNAPLKVYLNVNMTDRVSLASHNNSPGRSLMHCIRVSAHRLFILEVEYPFLFAGLTVRRSSPVNLKLTLPAVANSVPIGATGLSEHADGDKVLTCVTDSLESIASKAL